ncbi:MAG: homocysteine S-methyltransferase family protein [bacterium]
MKLNDALRSGIIICDGAMGTELQRLGLGKGVPPDSWNITNPELVKSVHKAYINAGAKAILTNTFGSNSMRVKGEYTVKQLNQAGAKIARECAGQDVLVFGDIGPTGYEDQLPPYGNLSEEKFYDAFKEQAVALAIAGVDAIIIETMSSLAEASIAVRAVKDNTSLPIICSMSFSRPPSSRPDDFRTSWGDSVKDFIDTIAQAGAEVLGSNCGDLVEEMPALAKKMREITQLPLIFEVNAGRPKVDDNYRSIYSLSPQALADIAVQLADAGANIVGGCCGTTPEHIAAIKDKLSKRK